MEEPLRIPDLPIKLGWQGLDEKSHTIYAARGQGWRADRLVVGNLEDLVARPWSRENQ